MKQKASLAISNFTLNDAVYEVVVYRTNCGNQGYAYARITDPNGKKYEGKDIECGYDKYQAAINLALKEFGAKGDVIISSIGLVKLSLRIMKNLKLVF